MLKMKLFAEMKYTLHRIVVWIPVAEWRLMRFWRMGLSLAEQHFTKLHVFQALVKASEIVSLINYI